MNKLLALTACLAVLFIGTTSFAEAKHCRRSSHFGVSIGQVVAPAPVCCNTYIVERYQPVYQAPACACAPVVYPVCYEQVLVRQPCVYAYPTIGFNFGWTWFR